MVLSDENEYQIVSLVCVYTEKPTNINKLTKNTEEDKSE